MKSVNLIFPHQLFKDAPCFKNEHDCILVEEHLFFGQYVFHKQKLAFHRASMKAYKDFLEHNGKQVTYISAAETHNDSRTLIPHLLAQGVSEIHYVDPTDFWLEKRLRKGAKECGIKLVKYDTQLFINETTYNDSFFKKDGKKYFQTKFYIAQRKRLGILLEAEDKPVGGKWSFDAENRKKYPKTKSAPVIQFPADTQYFQQARQYVEQHFSDNPGELSELPLYPINFKQSESWLEQFFVERFRDFGAFEDAIVSEEHFLEHSVLSPLINVGLLTPHEVVNHALSFAEKNNIPMNSLEGFIRQIIGWREFVRGVYEIKGVEERTKNFWGFNRKIPTSFYDGTTGIIPIDNTIKKILKTGYAHHIERLMVLGNYMLLCEFDPDEVYRWFMELFIDAYDWVMVPNVYGMSQFADGGLFATKPYISSSNYIMKMSNYKKGEWQATWDALFWRFMHVHRDLFAKNPRLGMLLKTFDNWPAEKKQSYLNHADSYLDSLNIKAVE